MPHSSQMLERKPTVLNGIPTADTFAALDPHGLLTASDLPENDMVEIRVKMEILKVGEIDSGRECFTADVIVRSYWRESTWDGKGRSEMNALSPKEVAALWNPGLVIDNYVTNLNQEANYMIEFDDQGHAYAVEVRRAKGTFIENMELMEFPFDTQDLTVTLSTTRTNVVLRFDRNQPKTVDVRPFVGCQEWNLHPLLKQSCDQGHHSLQCSSLSIMATVTRKAAFFMWNVVLLIVFISSLIFTSFAVERHLVQNRLQLSFIILLSNITFKFTVGRRLPPVSYLTTMDKYIITVMGLLAAVCVSHAIVYEVHLRNPQAAEVFDYIALGVLGFIYLVTQAGFLIKWQFLHRNKIKMRLPFFGQETRAAKVTREYHSPVHSPARQAIPHTRWKKIRPVSPSPWQ